MALAYAQYPGNGSTGPYNITFPFISKAHVQVKVDGTLVAFTWLTDTTIRLTAPAPINSIIDIRRVTPRDTLLVDFVDGSTLVESDLDLSALQVFYLSQEAFDLGEASLGVTEDGSFSALNRRISNVLDPVNATDVATKRFVETGMTSQLAAAVTAKDTSVVARQGSETARIGSEAARVGAETARDEARAHRDTASAHRLNAQNAQTGAETARAGAVAAKTDLEAARDTAVTKAGEANSSALAAAKSAQDAAIFDPSSYYTKTQTDGRYLTQTAAQSSYYTQVQVNAALSSRDANIATKLSLGGGEITGDLLITKNYPQVRYHYPGVRIWSSQVRENGHWYLWDESGGGPRFAALTDGSLWCSQIGDVKSYIENRGLAWANDRVANMSFRRTSHWHAGRPANVDASYEGPAGTVLYGLYVNGNGNINTLYFCYLQMFDPVRGWITISG